MGLGPWASASKIFCIAALNDPIPDNYTFLENSQPTPLLSQHFALSEK